MLKEQKVIAFLATRNGVQARKFFETALGLKVVADDDFALAIDSNETMVRIQKVGDFTPQPFTALGWEVSDIEATVQELQTRGVKFEKFAGMQQDERGIWRSPSGAYVAWFKDPDGNTLSLTQF
jgi:catechol 2,3-dioxygenase-like lactoylglutathione lyase family enzyme